MEVEVRSYSLGVLSNGLRLSERAEHCADKARLQSDPQLRQCFLEMQQRWLRLARSYEFAERLEFLSAVEERNKEARLIIKDAD